MIIRILLILAALIGLNIHGISFAEEQGKTIEADHTYIQYSGRVDFSNPKAPRFDWPGVSISARFTGTRCLVRLKDSNNEYNIFIDGKFNSVLVAAAYQKVYPVAQGLADGEHTILLTKRTEGSYGLAIFEGFILDPGAKLLPSPEAFRRKIEWVGDSLTCGYGNEGKYPTCKNLRDHENNYLAFGPAASRMLKAEYHIIAISGKGMMRNYGDPRPLSPDPLPYYYERTCQGLPSSHWDFKQWVPDAVVVTLGSNDYSTEPHPRAEDYITAYKRFLSIIRSNYPQAHIFCLSFFGMPSVQIRSVVESMKNSGDENVHFLENNQQCAMDEFGCDYHPRVSVHERLARYLSVEMAKVMNW